MKEYRDPYSSAPPQLQWASEKSLLTFGSDEWRIGDACEGTLILGATGSGKTSGSGRTIARAFLESGFGGVVLCAKPDEPDLWRRHIQEAGRSEDLRMFGPKEQWAFNFLQYESARSGAGAGITENIVSLFMEIASLGSGEAKSTGGDPFWERSMKSLVRNCVELITMSGDTVSLHAMFEIVRSAPPDLASVASEEWRAQSTCWRRIQRARICGEHTDWEVDLKEVIGYWLYQVPLLGEKTRGSIFAMFATLAEGLMRGKMRELFCSTTTLTPEDALSGKIVIVDLPIKEWSEIGRFAAVIWKYCIQKAVERRPLNTIGTARPLFIWADECQYFTSRYDTMFQATARSSKAATVYLTQSYPSLVGSLGGGMEGRTFTDSLIGNLGTKVFHANSDRETNQLAADLIGKRVHLFRSAGNSSNLSLGAQPSVGTGANRSANESMDLEIQPAEFALLKKGGPDSNFHSEAVIFQNGRRWLGTKRNWQKVAFSQRSQTQKIRRACP